MSKFCLGSLVFHSLIPLNYVDCYHPVRIVIKPTTIHLRRKRSFCFNITTVFFKTVDRIRCESVAECFELGFEIEVGPNAILNGV
jgi:hypothetical protein